MQMASNTYGKVSFQTGLRAEFSDITTELTETNEVNPRIPKIRKRKQLSKIRSADPIAVTQLQYSVVLNLV